MLVEHMIGVSIIPLQTSGHELGSWQVGLVAFAFVAWMLLVATLLERWEVDLHA